MTKNTYFHREAIDEDKDFILELLKSRLPQYNLHKKLLPSSKNNPEYRLLEVEEVDTLSVWVVLLGNQKVGAWHMQFEQNENHLRIFWLFSIELKKGVGSYIMQEVKKYSKKRGYSEVRLSVNLKNSSAMRCYLNNGFEVDEKYSQEIDMKVNI